MTERGKGEAVIQGELVRLERTLHLLTTKEGTMPVSKKKHTTSTPDPSTAEPSSPVLPEQQVFHQYLRTLAQSAVRIVIEAVMPEKLDPFIAPASTQFSPHPKRT